VGRDKKQPAPGFIQRVGPRLAMTEFGTCATQRGQTWRAPQAGAEPPYKGGEGVSKSHCGRCCSAGDLPQGALWNVTGSEEWDPLLGDNLPSEIK
jgi:hypothetical protein